MKSAVEKITPKMATTILEGNTHNRAFSSAMAMKYAAEMKAGRWRLNGESIIISKTNRLLDGQHRLYAVLESGQTIEAVVVRDASDDFFSTIDTGTARKGKDVLSIEKVSHPSATAAICAMVLRFQHNPNLGATKLHISNEVVLDYYKKNEEMVNHAVKLAVSRNMKRLLPYTATGFLAVVCDEFRPRVEQFFTALEAGVNLESTSPIWVLRERLQRDRANAGAWRRVEFTIALLVKAWNAYISGRTMNKISYAPDKESYPLPITNVRQLNRLATKSME